ncbi:hypothetical protein FB45DRAFT_1010395 [Roridomyces roridus]|uniref:Uncharacterized protein n=1 Tax=Roridomyces roridus TaxID=1738132 RepID=A0AAD7B3I6_9AGAR|nr:hypothetical protein FB45DRAFT_1010395 [Roridomyces roridus]
MQSKPKTRAQWIDIKQMVSGLSKEEIDEAGGLDGIRESFRPVLAEELEYLHKTERLIKKYIPELRDRHKSGIECNPALNLETVISLPRTEAEAHSAVKDEAAQGGDSDRGSPRRILSRRQLIPRVSSTVKEKGRLGRDGDGVEEKSKEAWATRLHPLHRLDSVLDLKVGMVEFEPTGDRPCGPWLRPVNSVYVIIHSPASSAVIDFCQPGFLLSQDLSARNGRRGYVSPIHSGPYARTPTTRIVSPLSVCARTPAVVDTLQPLPQLILGSALLLLRCC